jgi:opacity protein-like surface antigen
MRKTILVAAAIAFIPAASALAADNGIYIGGSIGRSNVKIDHIDVGGLRNDFDANDTGYKLIAGIRPLDWLAVEASYVNLGKPEDTVNGQKIKADGDGISAFGVGFFPVGPVDIYGKVGLISWDSKVSGLSKSGTDLAYGAGVQFRLLSLSLRAEYEVFNADPFDDVNMLSIGVTYTFL